MIEIVDRHVLQQVGRDLVSDMFETAISAAVAGDIGRREVADRQRCRSPKVARVVVPQVERLARTIADRIVRPRRDLIFAAVDRPCVAAALGSRVEAECGIGDDVDPRRRRRLARPQDRHIFSSVSREAAEPVEEFEVGGAAAVPASSNGGTVCFGAGLSGADRLHDALELFEQSAALGGKNDPRDGSEKVFRFGRDQVGAQQEDAARTALASRQRRRPACPDQGLDRDLKFLDIGGLAIVQDDQIDGELFHPPIFVRLQKLSHDVEVVDVGDAQKNDRQIAGNALPPQARLRAAPSQNRIRGGRMADAA